MTRKNPAPEPTLEPAPQPEAGPIIPNPYQVVRVSLNGAHHTLTRAQAELLGAKVLEGHAAVDRYGRWLPTKPHAAARGTDLTTTTGATPSTDKESK